MASPHRRRHSVDASYDISFDKENVTEPQTRVANKRNAASPGRALTPSAQSNGGRTPLSEIKSKRRSLAEPGSAQTPSILKKRSAASPGTSARRRRRRVSFAPKEAVVREYLKDDDEWRTPSPGAATQQLMREPAFATPSPVPDRKPSEPSHVSPVSDFSISSVSSASQSLSATTTSTATDAAGRASLGTLLETNEMTPVVDKKSPVVAHDSSIDLSIDDLSPVEDRRPRRLSVFSGRFMSPAVESKTAQRFDDDDDTITNMKLSTADENQVASAVVEASFTSEVEEETADGQTMEFTEAVGGIVKSAVNESVASSTGSAVADEDGVTMEFTQAIGGIVSSTKTEEATEEQNVSLASTAGNTSVDPEAMTMDFTEAIGGIVNTTVAMEKTQRIGDAPQQQKSDTPAASYNVDIGNRFNALMALGDVSVMHDDSIQLDESLASSTAPVDCDDEILLSSRLRDQANRASDASTDNVTMEFTQVVGGITHAAQEDGNDTTQEMSMEMTQVVGGIAKANADQSMEMTQVVGGITKAVSAPVDESMEMTQVVGGITKMAAAPVDESMEMTQVVGGITKTTSAPVDDSMEMTQVVGGIKSAIVAPPVDESFASSTNEKDSSCTSESAANEEQTMEFTTAYGGIEKLRQSIGSVRQSLGGLSAASPLDASFKSDVDMDGDSMDMTTAVGGIQNLRKSLGKIRESVGANVLGGGSVSLADLSDTADDSMDFTTAHGGIQGIRKSLGMLRQSMGGLNESAISNATVSDVDDDGITMDFTTTHGGIQNIRKSLGKLRQSLGGAVDVLESSMESMANTTVDVDDSMEMTQAVGGIMNLRKSIGRLRQSLGGRSAVPLNDSVQSAVDESTDDHDASGMDMTEAIGGITGIRKSLGNLRKSVGGLAVDADKGMDANESCEIEEFHGRKSILSSVLTGALRKTMVSKQKADQGEDGDDDEAADSPLRASNLNKSLELSMLVSNSDLQGRICEKQNRSLILNDSPEADDMDVSARMSSLWRRNDSDAPISYADFADVCKLEGADNTEACDIAREFLPAMDKIFTGDAEAGNATRTMQKDQLLFQALSERLEGQKLTAAIQAVQEDMETLQVENIELMSVVSHENPPVFQALRRCRSKDDVAVLQEQMSIVRDIAQIDAAAALASQIVRVLSSEHKDTTQKVDDFQREKSLMIQFASQLQEAVSIVDEEFAELCEALGGDIVGVANHDVTSGDVAVDAALERLEADVAEQQTVVDDLVATCSEKESAVKGLVAEIESLQTEVQEKQKTVVEKEEQVAKLSEEVAKSSLNGQELGVEGSESSLESQVYALAFEVQQLDDNVELYHALETLVPTRQSDDLQTYSFYNGLATLSMQVSAQEGSAEKVVKSFDWVLTPPEQNAPVAMSLMYSLLLAVPLRSLLPHNENAVSAASFLSLATFWLTRFHSCVHEWVSIQRTEKRVTAIRVAPAGEDVQGTAAVTFDFAFLQGRGLQFSATVCIDSDFISSFGAVPGWSFENRIGRMTAQRIETAVNDAVVQGGFGFWNVLVSKISEQMDEAVAAASP